MLDVTGVSRDLSDQGAVCTSARDAEGWDDVPVCRLIQGHG